ncbi:MAG: GIY-YIG nuclease family protein [Planctomycetes bacterium]|nr:GIY-YIG nuclease family protein [Planctomycetota bacterium]
MKLYYVYVLRSQLHPKQIYIGYTEDLQGRINQHNAGQSLHTSKFAPWDCMVALRFPTKGIAVTFERYLKTGSGRAFLKRHFLPSDN